MDCPARNLKTGLTAALSAALALLAPAVLVPAALVLGAGPASAQTAPAESGLPPAQPVPPVEPAGESAMEPAGEGAAQPAMPAAPAPSGSGPTPATAPAATTPSAAPVVVPVAEPPAGPDEALADKVDAAGSLGADSAEAEEAPVQEAAEAPEPGFLIPIDGDVFYEPELKVLISLPGPPPASMVLLVDGYPENIPLAVADGLVRVKLAGLRGGVHTVSLLLFNERTEIIAKEETRFFIRLPEPKREQKAGNFRHFGRFVSKVDFKGGEAKGRILSQSELKLEVDGGDTVITSGQDEKPLSQEVEGVAEAAYNVKYRQAQAYGKVMLRTDENRFRQPAHRVSANVKVGPWASLKAGDVYPAYNPLILSGTRVRGAEAGLALVVGDVQYASVKVTRGESRREVPAFIARYDTGGSVARVDTVAGTYAQDLVAARVGFGGGQYIDFGLTLLKAEDRLGSDLETELNNRLHGLKPVDNLVNGADIRIGLWDGRIQLYGEYAMSLYTKDRSLGAFSADSFDIAVDPKDFEDYFIFNATTRGWQHLVTTNTSGEDVDVAGFIDANTAYNVGFVSSIPLPGVVTETEFRYSHLGLEYHSEGNPFLGGNPGDGFTFIQRLGVLNNRLNLGLELAKQNQDLGFTLQEQRTVKGEIRFMPGPYTPSFVLGGGIANIVPVGDYPHQFRSGFANINSGAYHQFQLPEGKLHATLVYGFTQDEFDLEADVDSLDSEATITRTNIVNASAQYKHRNAGFIPMVNYSFTHNGIQQPTNTVALGFQQYFANNAARLDVTGTVGQYPETNEKNDISVGQSMNLEYRLTDGQSFRVREKWTQYGERRNILVGANYEIYF